MSSNLSSIFGTIVNIWFFSVSGVSHAAAHAVNDVIPGMTSISYLSFNLFWTYENVENIDGSPNVTNARSLPLSR